MSNIQIYQTTPNNSPALTDLVPFSNEANSHQTCNSTLQGIVNLINLSAAFQPNGGFETLDLSASDVALTNPPPAIIYLTNAPSGRSVLLPPANEVGAWQTGTNAVWFVNFSSNDVTIKDATGNPIGTVMKGVFTILLVLDNSTAAGSYDPIEFGTAFNANLPLPISDGGTGATTTSAALTNLGLGLLNIPQFASLYLNTPGSPTLKLTDSQSFSTAANGKWEYLQYNSASSLFNGFILETSSNNVTAGTENSQAQFGVMLNGTFISDAATITGNGLLDTQLNFTNSTKITNSLNALTLGASNIPQFASLYLVTAGQPVNKLVDSQSFSTGANGKWQYSQYNSASSLFDAFILQASSTSVTSGNESSQAQFGFILNGASVPNAVTFNGNGIQDTVLNYSNSGILTSTQTNLEIIGIQQSPLFFSSANTSPAIATQLSMSNGANYPVLQYVQSGFSYATATFKMPKRWNGGTILLDFSWFTSATSGNVVWIVDAAIVNSTNSVNPTFGTAVNTTSAALGSANEQINVATASVTPSGTASTNSTLIIRIYRNGGSGSDTMTATANLINSVLLNWTANAGNDA